MTRWEWTNRVLSASGPDSPTVRLVLVALLFQFYNEAKGYAFPSAATLAVRTGQCEKTVRTALVEAEAGGWLRRDAMSGHVTHYYPTVPEDRALVLDRGNAYRGGAVSRSVAPEAFTDDLRKEPKKPSKKEGKPPACPLCSAPMREERSRRTKEPMFWGCSRFRATGCKGKIEFGEEPDEDKLRAAELAKQEAKAKREAQEKADNEAAIARNRETAERFRKASAKPMTSALDMAQAALSGALRHPERTTA